MMIRQILIDIFMIEKTSPGKLKICEIQRLLDATILSGENRNTQEISDYLRWLVNSPVDLEFLFPTLQKSVKYLHDGFDTRQLIEYASKQCDQFPLYAVTLLQMAILAAKEVWWTPKDEDEEKIIEFIAKTAKPHRTRTKGKG